MAEDLKDLNSQLKGENNKLSNIQGAIKTLKKSLDRAKYGTPQYQSLVSQLQQRQAEESNQQTTIRNLKAKIDAASKSAETPENVSQKKQLEETLQRAKDKGDADAINKAQSALNTFTGKLKTPETAQVKTYLGTVEDGTQKSFEWRDNTLFLDGKPYTGSVVWSDGKVSYKNGAAEETSDKKTTASTQKTSTKTTATSKAVPAPSNDIPKPPPVVQTTEQKTSDAIAKAIELYQMPDIIFSNVPELKAILDRYLDPKSPTTLNQFLKEVSNSVWYRQNSKEIQNRFLQKFNYDDLVKKGLAKGDTQYEQDIKRITQNVIDEARRIGAPVDANQAALIAQDLYIHNMDGDAAALTKRLAGAIRTQPLGTGGVSGYLGKAESDYQNLLRLAKDNGLDLKTILPARISGANDQEITNNVLAGLTDGSLDISAIQQTARMMAAQGQPQYVKDLLNQGYDLAQIYAPYKKLMSNILELSPDQIDLNDPALRSAITNQGDMNTYDFQRNLRKDPRWQYTQNARQDVSNSVLGVLKDFGFQG